LIPNTRDSTTCEREMNLQMRCAMQPSDLAVWHAAFFPSGGLAQLSCMCYAFVPTVYEPHAGRPVKKTQQTPSCYNASLNMAPRLWSADRRRTISLQKHLVSALFTDVAAANLDIRPQNSFRLLASCSGVLLFMQSHADFLGSSYKKTRICDLYNDIFTIAHLDK